ncbi:regulator of Vps4 activity in the MVB pathway-domain-containing protein [Radiomyces spectabilis]|uniref:regulator of Vps4 activity in the MVB pathway-domain-containing protein n=1 Tax=Radiomyces spectabilis TaxID=64574 RepID=UPI00221F125F|nr:regulator of Vps4 activity in the MVB pathway-domain-containing protein [Radiomyces spectabilis]KAI8393294.1 regulator of Vps4 activity in the MVB pathway-domain-containing protein [Radiomyces spectabilis]
MFNPTRLKVQLKLAHNRLKMLQAKKNSLNQHQRREIATLLEKGKDESARVRVEHIIREDLLMEAMEILELYCDLLLARFGLVEQYRECDKGIAEAVNTIIWAAPRTGEVKELGAVRDQLAFKYGKEFMMEALENTNGGVNPRVIAKLQVSAPDPFLVERYLEEIAKAYNIPWRSNILAADEDDINTDEDDDDDGNGGTKEAATSALEPPLVAESSKPKEAEEQESTDLPALDLPDIPTNLPPLNKLNKKPATPSSSGSPSDRDGGANDDFDALAKRLDALKRR